MFHRDDLTGISVHHCERRDTGASRALHAAIRRETEDRATTNSPAMRAERLCVKTRSPPCRFHEARGYNALPLTLAEAMELPAFAVEAGGSFRNRSPWRRTLGVCCSEIGREPWCPRLAVEMILDLAPGGKLRPRPVNARGSTSSYSTRNSLSMRMPTGVDGRLRGHDGDGCSDRFENQLNIIWRRAARLSRPRQTCRVNQRPPTAAQPGACRAVPADGRCRNRSGPSHFSTMARNASGANGLLR
jgi:hypothetical protein